MLGMVVGRTNSPLFSWAFAAFVTAFVEEAYRLVEGRQGWTIVCGRASVLRVTWRMLGVHRLVKDRLSSVKE